MTQIKRKCIVILTTLLILASISIVPIIAGYIFIINNGFPHVYEINVLMLIPITTMWFVILLFYDIV